MTRVFMKGNEAIAEAAIRAGCRFFAGYPITPQNEIPEYMSRRLPEVGGVFVQGESEVASINMIYGAATTGTKAMTSSSSPGISLKAEGISYLAGSDLPAVIVNVMRGGPGLGSIQAAQMDYLQATKAAGHGGFRMLVYAPSTVQEAVDLTYLAFEKAESEKSPVMLVADGCIGSMMEAVELPEMKKDIEIEISTSFSKLMKTERKMVSSILPDQDLQESYNMQLDERYKRWNRDEKLVEEIEIEDAEFVIIAYGTSSRVAKSVLRYFRGLGVKVGLIRPIAIYPFPSESLDNLNFENVRNILSLELSIPAQMVEDVRAVVGSRANIITYGRAGGNLFTTEEVIEKIKLILAEGVK